MFTCYRITDVEYYLAEAAKADEAGQASERDSAAYYLDNGAGEDKGAWWTPGSGNPAPLVNRGEVVSPKAFRNMARGLHPKTGEPLIQTNKSKRTAGYDCQFAAPKSVSVLWAMATSEGRRAIEAAQDRAVDRAMDFIAAEGLVVARRGKNGEDKEQADDYAAARFRHSTSRAGDPQIHTHAVLLNVCVRQDGSTGTLDNKQILAYQGAIGAIYRTELASILEAEMGLATAKAERNFRVEGVPDAIVEVFSKRREAIETAAVMAGYSTADNRERARLEAVRTRDKKADVPEREELEAKWGREAQAVGWTPEAVWEAARAARVNRSDQAVRNEIHEETWRANERKEAGLKAIEELEGTSAVLERRHLLRHVVESCQTIGTTEEALEAFSRLEAEGLILQVGVLPKTGEPVFSTPGMIALEKQMLLDAKQRIGEREFVSPAAIEAAIAKRPTISQEQADFVRHTSNRDGVAVGEGSAGTGKSYSLGTVAEIYREAGAAVWTIAPSWKATGVIRSDTETAAEMAKAVQGFIARLDTDHKDCIRLDKRSCIIVDEAGMVATAQMAPLLAAARKAGAKVILAGDTRQLQPVTAGAPMAAIAKLCGTSRIQEIRRQKVDWQRAASTDFALGESDRALEAYDRAGRVDWCADRESALAAVAEAWKADVAERPDAGPTARLVLAARNVDLKELNPVLRQAYREAGKLGPEATEVTLQATTRGRNGAVADLLLAKGDRIIFGESVIVAGHQLRNSDMGTVQSITPSHNPNDPVVTFKMDNGEIVSDRWSLFGRPPEEDEPREPPKAQHAYAVTVHASQGTTVDKAFVLNAHGMGAESSYVAMTRHKLDAQMFIDTARVRDRIDAQKKGAKFTVSSTGKATGDDAEEGPQELADDEAGASQDMIRKVVLSETKEREAKWNVSDFANDVQGWLAGDDLVPEPAVPAPTPPDEPWMGMTEGYEALPPQLRESADRSYATWAEEKPELGERYDIGSYVAFVQEKEAGRREAGTAEKAKPSLLVKQADPTQAEAVAELTAKALDAVSPPGGKRPRLVQVPFGAVPARRITPNPRQGNRAGAAQAVASVPQVQAPVARIESNGAGALRQRMESRMSGPSYTPNAVTPLPRFSREQIDSMCKGIDLRHYVESDGWTVNKSKSGPGADRKRSWVLDRASDRIVVSCKNGSWVWMRRGANGGGDGNDGGTIIDYAQHVQRVGGRGVALRHVANLLGVKPEAEGNQPRTFQAQQAPERPTYDFRAIRSRWNAMAQGANAWLMGKRGIAREVLERFGADIRTEGGDRNSNKGGVAIAHRNEAGDVTGWSRKGPKHHPLDERSFSMSAEGAPKLMTRMGDRDNPRMIYVGESAIDLLSVYQLDRMPKGALLVSLDGNPGPEAWDELGKLAAKYPGARIGLHFDNDEAKPKLYSHSGIFLDEGAGTKFAQRAEEAIRAKAPEAVIVHRLPPADYKDWNDALRGTTRAQTKADRAATLARYSGPGASPEDRERAREQLDKHAFEAEVRRLWEAQEGGFLTPDQVEAGCKDLLDGQAVIRAAAQTREAPENERKLERGNKEEARQALAVRHLEGRKDGSLTPATIAGEEADFKRAEDNRCRDEEAKERKVREAEEMAERTREALRPEHSQAPGPRYG